MVTLLCALNVVFTTADKPRLSPAPVTSVTVKDNFWAPRQESLQKVTFQHELNMCVREGDLQNFTLAANGATSGFKGYVFQDSDTYKVIESIALGLAQKRNPALEAQVDKIVDDMAKAQLPDGYLDTHFQVKEPNGKWQHLAWNHELYCLGHMIEGAVAYAQVTGKTKFLNVATKFADLAVKRFLDEKHPGYPGHPEAELALVKLADYTGNTRYLDLAEHFITTRGSKYFAVENGEPLDKFDGTYWMDDMPLDQQSEIKGHAVRAGYLLTGVVDLLRHRDNPALEAMLHRVWSNANHKRVFVTGGTGPSGSNEGFTTDYDLPNYTAYQETCASISYAMWNNRMALLFGDAKYADAMETALYNGALAGISWKGDRFFYVNPLASRGNHHRQDWFGCACCPPNIARTIAQIGSYAYGTNDKDIYMNLYVGGDAKLKVGKQTVGLKVETNYPWDGKVKVTATTPGTYDLHLRIPGWSTGASLTTSFAKVEMATHQGYTSLNRTWKTGDSVTLDIPMPVRRLAAHPAVKEDRGRLATARGPLIYCLENVDNTMPVDQIAIRPDAVFKAQMDKNLFGGIVTLTTTGQAQSQALWGKELYATFLAPRDVAVKAVPYYLWDNRKPGDMVIWTPTVAPEPRIMTMEAAAKVSVSFKSGNAEIEGINDGADVTKSTEQPDRLCHFWPHKGGTEWVQYTWKTPQSVKGIKLFWFDDTGRGECRLPKNWRLEVQVNGAWQKYNSTPAEMDKWSEIQFAPVKTTAMRIVVEQQAGWASGIHEWKVLEADPN